MNLYEFSWTDAFFHDFKQAKKFYSKIFGWTFVDQFDGDQLVYSLACLDADAEPPESTAVAGAAPHIESMESPCHWMAYVKVENLEESVEKLKSANGFVYKGPMDVMDAGRMAVCADPSGKVIMLWQEKQHSGTQIKGVHGTPCWFELSTQNLDMAKDFYCSVFGWTCDPVENDDERYWMFKKGDSMVGGMHAKLEATGNQELWLTYFRVDDIQQSVKSLVDMNGTTVTEITPVPGMGHFAIVADFEGNLFGLAQFT